MDTYGEPMKAFPFLLIPKYKMRLFSSLLTLACIGVYALGQALSYDAFAQADNPDPPSQMVKLIFIHHSTGENWLMDGNGNLGIELGRNNYFVSDTNYGWGPEAIGDRTDIVNWLEWFRSPESPRYLAALYAENGQNAVYTRNQPDPGGENIIILIKSCFPNSNLEGNPDDPPAAGDGLTVSNAKFIYNELLKYFATRPDKLFVVITAPPVQDRTYAENARAFNTWLMQNWLAENSYPYANVAVWDFYTVLTGRDNHHRFQNGAVEHINNRGGNTSVYPTDGGDDHPSQAGNRKAMAEFVPMLNVFYNRWKASSPAGPTAPAAVSPEAASPAPPEPAAQSAATIPVEPAAVALTGGLIDNFEGVAPASGEGWQPFWDEATKTTIRCAADDSQARNGNRSLRVDFNVEANSWATCALFFSTPQDWRAATGLSFYMKANQAAFVFDIDIYGGANEERITYLYSLETVQADVHGWRQVDVPWSQFLRASWEADAGTPLDPARVVGIAVGFNTPPDAPNTGIIWVDDIHLTGTPAGAVVPTAVIEQTGDVVPTVSAVVPASAEPIQEETSTTGVAARSCPGSMTLAIFILVGGVGVRMSRLTRRGR